MHRFVFFSFLVVASVFAVELSEKRGGLCFRSDDNHTPAKWKRLAEVFEKHDFPLCASLNFVMGAPRPGWVQMVKDLQARGHEVMDHSPNHRVFQMRFGSDEAAAAMLGKPAVDHVSGSNVYFQYRLQKDAKPYGEGMARVSGNLFKPMGGGEVKRWRGIPFLRFDGVEGVFLLASQRDDGSFELRSFWGEGNVDLDAEREVRYHRLTKEQILSFPDALRVQAEAVRAVCTRHGLALPTTWIQPGGAEPVLWRWDVAAVFGKEFGYTSGATYPDCSLKCFNEYDPDGDRRFGMQWGNFIEDGQDLEWNKARIADGVARHYVMIGHSHLGGPAKLGGWEGTLKRTDELLSWCRETGIPVRTQTEWARILYDLKTDPAVNVFPALGMDRDANGVPDGLSLGWGVKVEASVAGTVLVATRSGKICMVNRLGGLEKGENQLRIAVEGALGSSLQTQVRFPGLRSAQAAEVTIGELGKAVLDCAVVVPPKASWGIVTLSCQLAKGTSLRMSQPVLSMPPVKR